MTVQYVLILKKKLQKQQHWSAYNFFSFFRYLYNERIQLQSVMTALTTLYAAHKYMCPGLAKQVKFALNVKVLFSFELAKQVMIQCKFVLSVKALFSFELAKQVMIQVKFVFHQKTKSSFD